MSCNYSDPSNNRIYRRPILGGCQISEYLQRTGWTNTLGFVAVDNYDNSVVGVCRGDAAFPSFTYNAYSSSFIGNQYWNNNELSLVNKPLYQNETQFLGIAKRKFPIINYYLCNSFTASTCWNYVNIALCTLPSSAVTPSESWKQIGLTGLTTPPVFASTVELNNIVTSGVQLFSSGAGTGPKGENGTKLLPIDYITASFQQNSSAVFLNDFAVFKDQLRIVATTGTTTSGICANSFTYEDTGSMVYGFFDGIPKIVGIIMSWGAIVISGTTYTNAVAYVNRIDNISSIMNISPYTGQTNVNFTDNPIISTYNVNTLSSESSIVIDNKVFFQAGTFNISNLVSEPIGSVYQFIPNKQAL